MIKIIFYIFAFIVAWRLLRYITTPILKQTKMYNYYSKMFFTIRFTPTLYELHLGTSWDFFKLQTVNPRLILKYLAEGLIQLANAIERGEIKPEAKIKGVVYYLKPTSTEKLGFKHRKLNAFEIFLFSLNYIELCILFSLSVKRPAIIKLNNIALHYCQAKDILKFKDKYIDYLDYFDKNQFEKRVLSN